MNKITENYGIIGHSEGIRQVLETVEQVATTNIAVLITGESGTGKELVAKAIHAKSRRANKQLVIVNCGAIPEGIIESELFGHEKGAFTGAIGPRKGYFESADGGTIFLDEIGEMPLNAQVKILRILEGREFTRVGGSDQYRVDVRIIAASNRSLDQEVKKGNFRQDLFFRLRAVNIVVPPLRSRGDDVIILAKKFAYDYATENNIDFKGFDESSEKILKNYSWPGNVRELKNLIESILVLEKGAMIDDFTLNKYLNYNPVEDRNLPIPLNKSTEQAEREFLYRALLDLKSEIAQLREIILTRMFPPKRLKPWSELEPVPYNAEPHEIDFEDAHENGSNPQTLQEMERELIENTLRRYGGNKRRAAKSLQISERTLYRKIKEYGLPF